MELINLAPPASSLIESIRSIGYSFESAIADIIDNSISAKATLVDINLNVTKENDLSVDIIDNGIGMSPIKLREAMSLGGKPGITRNKKDLGRFGLGLKTASFSQATILTVVSKTKDYGLTGIQWNLNNVIKNNTWDANQLNQSECEKLVKITSLEKYDNGTFVNWKDCDRLVQGLQDRSELSSHINRQIEELKKKLSLTFHKYLEKSKFNITVNEFILKPMDPFALKGGENLAHSQMLFSEEKYIDGSKIKITGYLLPHISRMGGIDREKQISLNAEHTASQGLYLYRLDRLISYGGWQKIIRSTEANKLARLEICFDNEADHLWQLDIKKSTATLPIALRSRIQDLIRGVSHRSNAVFMRRVRMKKTNPSSVWERIYDKSTNTVTYHIDREHPIIEKLCNENGGNEDLLEDLLIFIENTLPVDFISNDIVAGEGFVARSNQEIFDQISGLSEIVSNAGLNYEVFKQTIIGCGMYKLNPHELDFIIEKFKDKFV
jgi:hypothetical protein